MPSGWRVLALPNRGGDNMTFPGDVGQFIAQLVVTVVGPWVLKKIRDRDIREAIAHAADAALVLAITKSGKFADYGVLLRAVVAGILTDPSAPKQVTRNSEAAERAAAAAIARNSVGTATLVGDR